MRKVDENKIEEILKELTLDEKLDMIHGNAFFHTKGVERLGIPPLYTSDGPMGVRYEYHDANWVPVGLSDDYVTYLPSNTALAATWNRELAYETGKVLGEEARGRGKDVILGPGINIKRGPLCGRNFEYMSEDPKLISELTVPFIKGVQESDVAACVKHFAANSQETDRLMVDTIVDERTLQEIYFPGFKAAVREAGSYTIMGAYNKLNGEHCCENKELLDKVLRSDWEYDGTIISDWGGVHRTKEAAECALDIEMSVTDNFDEYYLANPLKKLIENGEISEETVNKKIRNILRLMLRLKMIGDDADKRAAGSFNTPEHREAALKTAQEGITLLKNKTLPLSRKKLYGKRIAVIGQNGAKIHSNGGGSAEIKALFEISPLLGLKMGLGGNTKVEYAGGYYIPMPPQQKFATSWQETSLMSKEELKEFCAKNGTLESGETKEQIEERTRKLKAEALKLAEECDEVIFVGGLNHDFDVEGGDRKDMKLPYNQDELILELLERKPDMTVVIFAGSPVDMHRWAGKVSNLVYMPYSGIRGGEALAGILLGDVNPSGKLPETFPKCYEDTPMFRIGEFGTEGRVEFKDGLKVGYRYYDDEGIEPEFCFGHGLSYTSFEYGDITANVIKSAEGTQTVQLSMSITNTGAVIGKETVQVYVADKECSVYRPKKELKDFAKLELKPGETRTVSFKLGEDAFSFYSVSNKAFVTEPGEFEILIGSSSRDIRKSVVVTL